MSEPVRTCPVCEWAAPDCTCDPVAADIERSEAERERDEHLAAILAELPPFLRTPSSEEYERAARIVARGRSEREAEMVAERTAIERAAYERAARDCWEQAEAIARKDRNGSLFPAVSALHKQERRIRALAAPATEEE